MKLIPLTKGYSAMVDDADYEKLAAMKWQAFVASSKDGRHRVYAHKKIRFEPKGKRFSVFMHRMLLGCLEDVDHRDGNGLNNQRENLRPATQTQNCGNQRKQLGTVSQWKGVAWDKRGKKWVAKCAGSYLGLFREECDAAQAYNLKAEEVFGDFARLNQAANI